jgi:hypothetical protein
VRHQPLLHRPSAGQHQAGGQVQPVQERGSRAGMAQANPIMGSPAKSTR